MNGSSGPGGQEVNGRKVGRREVEGIRVSFLVGLGEEGFGRSGIDVGMGDRRIFKPRVVVDVNDVVGISVEVDSAGG